MKLVKDKEKCCGCSACAERCPVKAITMTVDEEGFYYPVINEDNCTDCGLCLKVCRNTPWDNDLQNQKYYAVKSRSVADRMRSRSGGFFFELAKQIVNVNGAVYGVVMEDDCNVRYKRAATLEEVKLMQGSKYVESDILGIYPYVENDLKDGLRVLFSGTACQVAGLYGYLSLKKVDQSRLVTIDIVCHGVPSRKVLEDYIRFAEKKYKGSIEAFNFRDKSFGWNTHVETYIINGKKRARKNYTNLFYTNLCLRPSCGNCAFASYQRPADITIADFWGLNEKLQGFDDNKGVSAVLVNTQKGADAFAAIKDCVDIHEVDKETCSQPNLHKPTKIPANRAEFWKVYKEKGFMGVMKAYGRYDLLRRIKWHLIDFRKIKNNR